MSKRLQPRKTQNLGHFSKGQSGNPKGRPVAAPAPHTSAFNVLIHKKLVFTRNGVPQEITIEQALQHQTFKKALAGERLAQKEVFQWIKKREAWLNKNALNRMQTPPSLRFSHDPSNVDDALVLLGIAVPNPDRLNLRDDRLQLLLEPWAVQLALDRKGVATKFPRGGGDDNIRCVRDPSSLIWPIGRKKRGLKR